MNKSEIARMATFAQRRGRLRLTVPEAQEVINAIHGEPPVVDLAAAIAANPSSRRGNEIFAVPLVLVDDPAESDLAEQDRKEQDS